MSEWDNRYRTDDYVFGTAPNDFLAEVATRIPAGRVLCLGEGEGRNGVHLASLGYEVTGVDGSEVGLSKARALAASRRVALATIVADLATFDLGEACWQGITSIFVHLPPALRADLYPRVVRALAPGGVFVLEAYTPRQHEIGGVGGPPPSLADWLLTLERVRAELPGLEVVIGRELDRDVNEGARHSGPSAVVQVLAVKP
ncbi:SAM-dependent methyltransferase [Luteitalea sp. TBR-22]|uniref:SAM-dependent methyltransferase n=1 Tax=Luteitalea sp. TBR-22 TaxID=2802971 RepID=UPI001AF744C0|nr:class I SAM-dependent methyltransferase [Luteitalea sp. TBR-22]BCS34107.1 SAM-dependent methyltransferase [Luteitalea sp. TBR-22]